MEIQKLSSEEIADVFALYNKQGARHVGFMGTGGTNDKMYYVLDSVLNEDNEGDDVKTFDDWKLLLSRLEDITDEDANPLYTLMNGKPYTGNIEIETVSERLLYCIRIFQSQGKSLPYNVTQELINRRFEVPLWFGIDHWANGKTAIELGIAIDKNKKG
mgnify:CR=1 FL=1